MVPATLTHGSPQALLFSAASQSANTATPASRGMSAAGALGRAAGADVWPTPSDFGTNLDHPRLSSGLPSSSRRFGKSPPPFLACPNDIRAVQAVQLSS